MESKPFEQNSSELRPIKEWKGISVGGKDATTFETDFTEKKISVSGKAEEITANVIFTSNKEEVDFVVISQKDLQGISTEKASDPRTFLSNDFLKANDLELCQPTDAWYIREQYADQSEGELVSVGMDPLPDLDKTMRLYVLGHYPEGIELSTMSLLYGHPEDKSDTHLRTNPTTLWLFRKIPRA